MIKVDNRFSAVLLHNKQLMPNTWDVTVDLIAGDNITSNYHTALERVQFLLTDNLENSLFLGHEDINFLQQNYPLRGTVHLFPDDPHDHLIAICLYTKISSILSNVFYVDRVQVSSYQGAGVTHSHTPDDGDLQILRGLFEEADTREYVDYWYKPNINFFTFEDGVVQLKEYKWDELNLQYDANNTKYDNNVVKLSNFKPRIVPRDDDDNIA